MGIFSRRRTDWQPDGTGVMGGGDIGGDIQVGEDSYSVRFMHPDRPGRLVTITYYPVEYDNAPGEFVVQRQVEWMICDDPADPGDTEVWSDVDYDDVSDRFHDTAESAEQEARECAEYALTDADSINWDGEPFRAGD